MKIGGKREADVQIKDENKIKKIKSKDGIALEKC